MNKVFFVVNDLHEFTFQSYIDKYLSDVAVSIGQEPPDNPSEYAMVVLWNYQKIIKPNKKYKNYIVFHSSPLPVGRGWAPIYHAFVDEMNYYTVTGIFAEDEVDTGDIIIRARFHMRPEYTATMVRQWDDEIMVILVKKILERYPEHQFDASPQVGESSYYNRRYPKEGEINVSDTISSVLNHLRGCTKQNPVFFFYEGIKYIINVEPEISPEFPNDLEISFKDDGEWIPA